MTDQGPALKVGDRVHVESAWEIAKAACAARRVNLPMQPRDDLGFIVLRDGARKFDTWLAWASARKMDQLEKWDLRAVLQQLPKPQRRAVEQINGLAS